MTGDAGIEDTTLVHLATAWQSGYIKLGGVGRGSLARWTELIRIEAQLAPSLMHIEPPRVSCTEAGALRFAIIALLRGRRRRATARAPAMTALPGAQHHLRGIRLIVAAAARPLMDTAAKYSRTARLDRVGTPRRRRLVALGPQPALLRTRRPGSALRGAFRGVDDVLLSALALSADAEAAITFLSPLL
jgi:hypothetical protein